MTKDRRLGRGLAALLGNPLEDSLLRVHHGEEDGEAPVEDRLLHLNVYEIDDNPFQPRRDFRDEEIHSLAESLKSHDMLLPILVRKVGDRYQLISGERRLRAAIHAGWSTVPARLREADDRLVAELAIVENLQRKDLNAVEKACSFKRYLDQHRCTQEEFAQRLKIDRSTIANLIRLLELPEYVLDCLRNERISAGHARALLPLGDDELQIDFCNRIINEDWSVRDAERLVVERIAHEDGEAPVPVPLAKKAKNEHMAALEQNLRMALGTRVEIRHTSRGKGKFIIHFDGQNEFERLKSQFGG